MMGASKFLSALTVALSLSLLLTGCGEEKPPEPVGTENQRNGKAALQSTADKWISWRYFNSRRMFYFTQLVSWRCGIKSARWGLTADELGNDFEIPDCDEEEPNRVPRDFAIHIYTDEIASKSGVQNDSFIGVGGADENQVSTMFVELTYFDGTVSNVVEFKAPKRVLEGKD